MFQEKGRWRIGKNREWRTLYKDPEIIALVKSKILRWLGHVQRRREDQIIKSLDKKTRWDKTIGKTKDLRWRDQVLVDLVPN